MKKKKILVVDDNQDINEILTRSLELSHYEVFDAFDGYEGLYKYLRHKPDLIILDVMMPNLNGYEVCREIRREVKDVKTPIIMLTAKCEDYDRIKGKVIGATQYMLKPYDFENLLEIIKELLHES